MKLTLKEMNGLLNGKYLPSDLIVGETLAEYLVRKFAEADAKCAALAAENAGLNFLTIALRHTTYDQIDLDDVTLAFKMSLPETTATDAFLAEVRAQGAEECVRQLVTSDDDDFLDAPNVCSMVANQLRKGVQS